MDHLVLDGPSTPVFVKPSRYAPPPTPSSRVPETVCHVRPLPSSSTTVIGSVEVGPRDEGWHDGGTGERVHDDRAGATVSLCVRLSCAHSWFGAWRVVLVHAGVGVARAPRYVTWGSTVGPLPNLRLKTDPPTTRGPRTSKEGVGRRRGGSGEAQQRVFLERQQYL